MQGSPHTKKKDRDNNNNNDDDALKGGVFVCFKTNNKRWTEKQTKKKANRGKEVLYVCVCYIGIFG